MKGVIFFHFSLRDMFIAERTLAALNQSAGHPKVTDAAICSLLAATIGALARCDLLLGAQGRNQLGWATVNLCLLVNFVVEGGQTWL